MSAWSLDRDRVSRPGRSALLLGDWRRRESHVMAPGAFPGHGGRSLASAREVDADGRVLVRLSGYETVALPGAAGGDLIVPLEAALR